MVALDAPFILFLFNLILPTERAILCGQDLFISGEA